MTRVNWLTVPISQLETGLPLRFDIYSKRGDQLAKAGDEFSNSTRASWLQIGLDCVFAKQLVATTEESMMAPYDPAVLKSLQDSLDLAVGVIVETSKQRGSKHVVTMMEYEVLSDDILQCVQKDTAAAMSFFCQSMFNSCSEESALLAHRCSQMSLLSMAIATELGMVPSECQIVGIAAMLHDISLMDELSTFDNPTEYYRNHPIESASIVESIIGVDPQIGIAISQVHESPAGDGFPRGLSSNRISRYARIVNLADTYLTLTLDKQLCLMPQAKHFHPADAVGYLMFQATQGRFEMEAVRALIRASSVYPVGSRVILSDDSTAVVFRSTKVSPSKPIVRLDATQSLVDLRHSSMSVRSPERNSGGNQPLLRSQLANILWI